MVKKTQKKFRVQFIGKVSSNKRISIPSRICDVKDGDKILVTIESLSRSG